MISKELLSEVLKQETRFIRYVANNTYEVHFEKPIRLKYIIINIYELAHKCKEWALRKNYILASESNTYGGICNMSISSIDIDVFYNIQSTTRANTEVEAIIQACEWILNNKDRK